MRYAFFNPEGRIESAHNDDTTTELPSGAVVLTDDEWACRFDLRLDGGLLINDPLAISLTDIKAAMWDAIKRERDRRRFSGGVKVGAHWYLSTAIATSEYNSLAIISAAMPDNAILRADWRTMDGGEVDMTPVLARQILAAGFAAVAAIDDAAKVHKAAMEASAEPAAYDFSAGWPAVYGD